ncbi:GDSL-type esterase/lipase family protein [Leekyejoonella antrihumi]|uniref:SGNH/GDSL hydrolase family protein n=1 Tax=Leekyejoonella antrihumi TaxID=1660198 RepID=A0A563E1U2_9MICO|nr:GDSL-type esterase/lipase family protein [Leekyejoonella antrihumi]TWP36375.1 SGNH/GDSL hydrolase family protein [Leekyejoonella antrihumi]
MSRRIRTAITYLIITILVAAASIAVALAVTPAQSVSAAGQTVQVGVAGPSTQLSGPGELDLFGQKLPTTVQFAGPIRPRIQLTHITLSKQLEEFASTSSGTNPTTSIADALVQGFRRYFYWQVAMVGLVAIVLAGAIAGWMRRGRGRSLALIVSIAVITEAINLGAIMTTAYSAPAKLSHVHSLQALVGDAPDLHAPVTRAPSPASGSIVVIGDSTAAGLGNPLVSHPTATDRACHRSIDSYAIALARSSSTPVTNLACSGATTADGLLGPQKAGSLTVPAQLSRPAVAAATTVIVSIGANDVQWSTQLRICAVSVSCRNNADQAAFQQDLSQFSTNYLQLLSRLQALPKHPQVVINLYYDPFGDDVRCLSHLGVTTDKQQATLSKRTALNHVLQSGAQAASFQTASPDFSGHGLCSETPFVQGVKSAAPFHPTPAGELAIALADQHALQRPEAPSVTQAPTSSTG